MPAEPRLVHIVDDVPELDGSPEHLTMVLVLDGFLDAGNAAARAARHLVDLEEDGLLGPPAVPSSSRVVATFDVDQFHDYRARRPAISFVRDHYASYDAPRLVVRLLRDSGGTPYLLLQGPEPDNRWEAFARAVREVVERFGVTRVVSMGSVPMAVPHTRPVALTHHANDPELLLGATSPWRGELRVPSSAQALLEVRLGEWGHPAQGFVAHIPHYLAQLDYPRASAALLEQVELAGRLTLDLSVLHAEAEQREEEITAYLADNAEVDDVVQALERQYDAFERAEESGGNLLAPDEPLPTGEEIGQQFEQFLAGLEEPDDQGPDVAGPDTTGRD
ncbi:MULTISPECIES: PAC2 family protein [Nocardioides]|uniref:PAC2 family protein n=1 Tax=Nocardioides TaxID=1839 RepID=UPI00204196C1|nr:PAC2 family protein [Nocardioides sp. P86]MCM3515442.1 PAC2 family protein [Nocardioides sp. P86]